MQDLEQQKARAQFLVQRLREQLVSAEAIAFAGYSGTQESFNQYMKQLGETV
jgi:hypothetical protein